MKTLIIYYSYTGKTREIAENIAKNEDADIIEVKEIKKRSTFNAYIFGSFAARKQQKAELLDFNSDFSPYNKIIIAMPIWAGYPAPAINNIIDLVPRGKEVELIMVSGGGGSKGSCEKTKALVEEKGAIVVEYKDVRG